MNYILINIIEFIYIFYILTQFKTKYSIHHPFEYLTSQYSFIQHPIYSGNYENKICSFGHSCAYISIIYFLYRIIYFHLYNSINHTISTIILYTSIIITLSMNMNAFIYLLPIFILEYYLIYY